MNANDIMNLNNIIYRLYDEKDFEQMKIDFLRNIRMLIPCSYASFLMSNRDKNNEKLVNPCCDPPSFTEVEEKYLSIESADHFRWLTSSHQSVVARESQLISKEKRLESSIYKGLYEEYDIFDTLQLSVVYNKEFYAVLTMYRTTGEGEFTEDDSFWLKMVSVHLAKRFYDASQEELKGTTCAMSPEELKEAYALTNREAEILSLVFENLSDDEIADKTCISPYTVKKHIQNIYRKLGISARWELLRFKY